MPSLAESLGQDMSNYVPVESSVKTPTASAPSVNLEPGLNVFLRCPLPPVWTANPDSQRQFYQSSSVPQFRMFTPPAVPVGSGNTTVTENVSSSSSSGGGSSSSSIAVLQTSVTTPGIGPGNSFVGSVVLSKSFQLLVVTASAPCRIRLYGTAAAQAADSYRGLDVPPPAGDIQNIISDVALDTSPFHWTFQDRVGASGDSPMTATVYLTVTNLDVTTDVITVTFSYAPIVNV